jgi:LPS-assembly protein
VPRSSSPPRPPFRISRIGLGLLCVCAPALLRAQTSGPLAPDADVEALRLKPVRSLGAAGKSGAKPAMVLSAKRLNSSVDQLSTAEGEAELRYGELLLRADRLSYDQVEDLARASGHVAVSRSGSVFRGPELHLYVGRFEGEFLNPSYFFSQTGGGGRAERVSFLDDKHVIAEKGNYSSCPIVGDEEPAWQIRAARLQMDFENNEGVATDAVVRFQGVTILAAPTLSFPLGNGRKSGWLPPRIGLDNRSGFEYGMPYYWNIAPQRDATLAPFFMTKRGAGLDSEFRYLEPQHKGQLNLNLLPNDRVAERSRWALNVVQDGALSHDWHYRVRAERVSDDDYWKDLPDRLESRTERLLLGDLQLNRRRELSWGEVRTYARVQQWQALQGLDPTVRFETPYQRTPQIGARLTTAADDSVLAGYSPWGSSGRLEGAMELEYNRFDRSPDALAFQLQTGQRVHLLGHVSAPISGTAWWLIPRLAINSAAYALDRPQPDGRTSINRTIPTFSIDNGWVFERDTQLLGRYLRQTLEPRLLFVNTPFRRQDSPNFDSAPKDFNFDSVYTENQFNGIDRVSDARTLTAGAISRWINPDKGEEVLRLGLVQRFQFSDQRVTPDGVPVTQRFSDLLLLGATHLTERWWADGTLQYNSETGRSERTVLRARYSPGPFRTISTAYRLARGQSEQVELAWQWPLFGQGSRTAPRAGSAGGASASSSGSCGGAWYSAGHVQYSLKDKRLTDSIVGFEYDAGCWVMRVGIERESTGREEANTRLMLQLELVGLSQLGSNALKVLRDNIPGYRPLSSDRSASLEAPYD